MKRLPEPPLEPPPSYWDEHEEDSAPESWLDRFLKEKKIMRIIEPSVEILHAPDYQQMLTHTELAARTCYKSEDRIKDGSAEELIKRLIASGHHSVLEHQSISVRFICDRGVSHELVRHRLCSFSQESTRYCNYLGEKFGSALTFIRPMFFFGDDITYQIWSDAMFAVESAYFDLLKEGASPQEARSVLPNSLKTEIVVTANIRQWRTMFEQRCAPAAHPQMRQVMLPLLHRFIENYAVFFEGMTDLYWHGRGQFDHNGWQLAEVK